MTMTESQLKTLKPKLRWYQYSLRSLLLLMLVVSIVMSGISWLTTTMRRARRQREAAVAVEWLGGTVVYDFQLDESGKEIQGAEPPDPIGLRRYLGDDFFVNVVRVNLNSTKVTDAELEQLKGLTQLKVLELGGTKVTDEGVKKLQQAFPNCKIIWQPPTKDERQGRAAPDQSGG